MQDEGSPPAAGRPPAVTATLSAALFSTPAVEITRSQADRICSRAKRTGLNGRFGEAWKLDLAASPVDGKPNDECIRFFADLPQESLDALLA